ncbi:MAG TPA: hypothetical protein VJS11_14775 [Acidobacteriaceae bacterium]|nr:hypothetical protein [Acidobacteriaceae bacterium]
MTTNTLCSVHSTKAISRALMATSALTLTTVRPPLLSANERWLGLVGESLFVQKSGPDIISFRAYDAHSGKPALKLSTLAWRVPLHRETV